VKCFTAILDGGVMLNGFQRDGLVFINSDLAGSGSVVAGRQALSDRLMKVALEEVVHHVTGATDNSRDFQDFVLDLAVKLSRSKSETNMEVP
jgi:major membrane immunogen (membrane-anchored lipoprotein)